MRVKDIDSFVIAWMRRWGLPKQLKADLIQEAWVTALESAFNTVAVRNALQRFAGREYATPMPESCLGALPSGDEIKLSHFPESAQRKRILWRKEPTSVASR